MHTTSRFFTSLALLAFSSTSMAGTLFVDANLASGANDGSSWADAFQGASGLQTALAASVSGDEVYVADGTYFPTAGASRTLSFRLKTGVEIYGSFAGGESSPSERPAFGTSPSILSGDLSGNDGSNLFNDNSFHVVNGASANATAILDGFEVRGGNSNGGTNNDRGGGIFCDNGSNAMIRNCFFIGNRCSFGGGAGYIRNSAPRFLGCEFRDNLGGSFGGAFDVFSSGSVRFDRCTFTGNRAARAGALEFFSTNGAVISNSVFHDNTATGGSGGGALWFGSGGNAQVRNCTVVANSALAQAAAGLRNQGASVTVSNCIFWDNAGPGGAQNSANQISGAAATYSIVEGGLAGAGNSSLNPQFVNVGAGDLNLSGASPAIDAGNNGQVAAGLNFDNANNPRFLDEPAVANTGVGIVPVIDMGAFEYSDPQFDTFCFGDGSGNSCPCANESTLGHGGGCAHGSGDGGILSASGLPSVSNSTLQFGLSSARLNSFSVLVSGDNRLPLVGNIGNGIQSFDGLRCAGGNFRRHGSRAINFSGVTTGWGPGLIGQTQSFTAGQMRHFFVLFRTPGTETCGLGLNSSNGVSVTFVN